MEQEVTVEDIIRQLKAIALADVTRAVTIRDGQPVIADTDSLPEAVRLAVAGVEKSAGGVKVKFYDKLKALELLGRALGLFEQKPAATAQSNDLLQAVLDSTREVTDHGDIPEV